VTRRVCDPRCLTFPSNILQKLDKRTQAFARDVLTQHGAIYFFMYAYKEAGGAVRTGSQEWTGLYRGRSFDSEMRKEWDECGAFPIWDSWAKHSLGEGKPGTVGAVAPDLVNGRDPALFELERNDKQQPLLPDVMEKKGAKAAGMKYSAWVVAVYRAFVTYWFGVGRGIVGRRVKVPWKYLGSSEIDVWLSEEFVPEGSTLLGDPDKDMGGLDGLLPLLQHWYKRQEDGEDEVLRFHHVAELIPGQNKKYKRVSAVGDPEDFEIPARPDVDDSDSAEDDTPQTRDVEGDETAGKDAHGVRPKAGSRVPAQKRANRKTTNRSRSASPDDSSNEAPRQRRRQKGGAKSGLLTADGEGTATAVRPDAPDAQYRFVEGGTKYEVEENFEEELAKIDEEPDWSGAEAGGPFGGPVSSFAEQPDSDEDNGGAFGGRGPLLSFLAEGRDSDEESDIPLAHTKTTTKAASGLQPTQSDPDYDSDENDVTRMLDMVEGLSDDDFEGLGGAPSKGGEETLPENRQSPSPVPTDSNPPPSASTAGIEKGKATRGDKRGKHKAAAKSVEVAPDAGTKTSSGKRKKQDPPEANARKRKVREAGDAETVEPRWGKKAKTVSDDPEPAHPVAETPVRESRRQKALKDGAAQPPIQVPETPVRVTRARSVEATPATAATPATPRRNPRRNGAPHIMSPIPETGVAKKGKPKPRLRTTANKRDANGRDEWDMSERVKGRRV
jgi:hypothetical protein